MKEENGAGALLAITMTWLVCFVALAVAGAVGIVARHRGAQAAADLAALAGAASLQEGEDPCVRASVVATRNGAVLHVCRVTGSEVWIEVTVGGRPLLGRTVVQRARSRAGPVTP